LHDVNLIIQNWEELELPLYSPHYEEEFGLPEKTTAFNKTINQSDGIVISLAEHNSMPTAAFKNLWDWVSRINKKVWSDKPIFLAATSPGGRGAQSALNIIKDLMPQYRGNVIVDYSLPKFHDNFTHNGIKDEEKAQELKGKIHQFQTAIND